MVAVVATASCKNTRHRFVQRLLYNTLLFTARYSSTLVTIVRMDVIAVRIRISHSKVRSNVLALSVSNAR